MKRLMTWALMASFCLSWLTGTAYAQRNIKQELGYWKLAFVRKNDIWIAKGDGSGQKRIIEKGYAPAWSPDRKQIAFARGSNIWLANADGSKQRRLTNFEETVPAQGYDEDIEISWRPHTDQITFSYGENFVASRLKNKGLDPPADDRDFPSVSILDVGIRGWEHDNVAVRFYIHDWHAGNIMRFSYQASPAWSPQGKTLLFVRDGDIWIADKEPESDGGRPGFNVTRLSAVARYDANTYSADKFNDVARHLSWSPGMKFVAFGFGRAPEDSEIRLLRLARTKDGEITTVGKSRLLSDPKSRGTWPTFSPDGRFVAYESPGAEIWVVSLRDGRRVRVIQNGKEPAW
jgi:Tol biopolymer transport system component